jgi:hypothetical protein
MPNEHHGLGRLASVDLRDHLFLAAPPKPASDLRSRLWFPSPPILDQGQTPQCVGYSSAKFLAAGPVRNLKNVPSPADIYSAANSSDEWSPSPHDGTSVRAAFKYLAASGYIQTYNWAYTVDVVVDWLLTTGPMVFGTIWTDSMFNSTPGGFLKVEGSPIGGHAYLIRGVNRDKKCPDKSVGAVRMVNSWGESWGQKGQAWIALTDVAKLLAEDGEACTAKEILKPVPKASEPAAQPYQRGQ